MNRQDNGDNFLSAHKPRPWGEGAIDSSAYSKPDPSSKTNIPAMESERQFTTGSTVVPWNSFSF